MAQIICHDVTLGYEGQPVVRHLNFEVNRGDYLCIVGENGSGKSTLSRAVLKLKQPMQGVIETGDGLKASEIGYLPQQTLVQRDFPASVWEIVLSGARNSCGFRPFYGKREKELARQTMEELHISALAKRCYRELSGGQQQRVLLARALCATRKLLLLDEPVAGLDPLAAQELYELIQTLNRERNITILMVTHDIPAALQYASHILHVGETPLFYGTVEDYRTSSACMQYRLPAADRQHDRTEASAVIGGKGNQTGKGGQKDA